MVRSFTHRRSAHASVVSGATSSLTKKESDKKISEAEAQVTQKPIAEVRDKEFLSLTDTAILFGITKRSVYNLIYNGVLQAFKFSSRMTYVRKADIEAMFNGNTYTKKIKPEKKPITEFYTTAEINASLYLISGKERHIVIQCKSKDNQDSIISPSSINKNALRQSRLA